MPKKKDLLSICKFLPPHGREFIKEVTNDDAADFVDDVDGYSAEEFNDIPED